VSAVQNQLPSKLDTSQQMQAVVSSVAGELRCAFVCLAVCSQCGNHIAAKFAAGVTF
jgi:hypothetical protein